MHGFQRNTVGSQLARVGVHLDFPLTPSRHTHCCHTLDGLQARFYLVQSNLIELILALRPVQDDLHDRDGVHLSFDDGRIKGFRRQVATHGGYLALHLDGCLIAVYALFEGDDHKAHSFLGYRKDLVDARDASHGVLNRHNHQIFDIFRPGAGKNSHHTDKGEIYRRVAIYLHLIQRAVAHYHQSQDDHEHSQWSVD